MKQHPIIMGKESIDALKNRRKSQTRLVIKRTPFMQLKTKDYYDETPTILSNGSVLWNTKPEYIAIKWIEKCPYRVGDQLWVKENACYVFDSDGDTGETQGVCRYTADLYESHKHNFDWTGFSGEFSGVGGCTGNRSSILMPRWASRFMLEITNICVERVQAITNEDAKAEGVLSIGVYEMLWNKLHEKHGYGWNKNPFVWVIEFKTINEF